MVTEVEKVLEEMELGRPVDSDIQALLVRAKAHVAHDDPLGDRWADGATRRTEEPPAKLARGSRPNPAFADGTNVRLQNLVKATHLNEELGTIEGFDEKTLRYAVRVVASNETARVQEKNMRLSLFGNGPKG